MAFIGQIEGATSASGIAKANWIQLIASHPNLSAIPPREGINPFTKRPTFFNAPPTSAMVSTQGTAIGTIAWAQDGSSSLVVEADDESADAIARVAEEIATSLGGTFSRRTVEE